MQLALASKLVRYRICNAMLEKAVCVGLSCFDVDGTSPRSVRGMGHRNLWHVVKRSECENRSCQRTPFTDSTMST